VSKKKALGLLLQ